MPSLADRIFPRKASPLQIAALIFMGLALTIGAAFLVAPPKATEPRADARVAFEDRLHRAEADCMGAVRNRVQFPSKADFRPHTLDTMERIDKAPLTAKTFMYRGRVDLMNSFGAMIPHRYECVLSLAESAFVHVSIAPE